MKILDFLRRFKTRFKDMTSYITSNDWESQNCYCVPFLLPNFESRGQPNCSPANNPVFKAFGPLPRIRRWFKCYLSGFCQKIWNVEIPTFAFFRILPQAGFNFSKFIGEILTSSPFQSRSLRRKKTQKQRHNEKWIAKQEAYGS